VLASFWGLFLGRTVGQADLGLGVAGVQSAGVLSCND